MKGKITLTLLLGVALLMGGLTYAMQRVDLANNVNAYVTFPPAIRANSATTGTAVDLANYGAAALQVYADSIDAGQPSLYVVLQDSLRSSTDTAWTAVDSVLVDSAAASPGGSRYKELGYTGIGRYLRAVQRASGAAGDSVATAAVILRGACRVAPC